jgi:23S rRNA (uracil1939-C5)-methyltransferase
MIGKVEKLIYNGYGLIKTNGKVVLLRDVLPNEIVQYEIVKNKKKYFLGKVKKVIRPSRFRINPRVKHYFICSPRQIINRFEEIKIKKIF